MERFYPFQLTLLREITYYKKGSIFLQHSFCQKKMFPFLKN